MEVLRSAMSADQLGDVGIMLSHGCSNTGSSAFPALDEPSRAESTFTVRELMIELTTALAAS